MTSRTVDQLEASVRESLRRSPYATLAVLAGVGYLLGGGLPVMLTRGVLGIGGRMAMERMMMRAVGPAARSR